MYIFRFLISVYLFKFTVSFTSAKIWPEAEFHHKSRTLLITCNATQEHEKPVLIYKYSGSNYTIPKVNSIHPFTYTGNFTNSDPSQFKVNVLCLKASNGEYLTSKIYFFGYSPSEFLSGASKPRLNCRDFNLHRIVCCIVPSWSEIAAKSCPLEEYNGNLNVSLVNLNSGNPEQRRNDSCFSVTEKVFTLSIHLQLFITNDLGKFSDTITVNRPSIFKPDRPDVALEPLEDYGFQMTVVPKDSGEFVMNYTCSSTSPSLIVKNFSTNISGKKMIRVDGWIPNSRVACLTQFQMLYGNSGIGQFSEEAKANVKIAEGIPNSGPFISPAFVTYDSISNHGYLKNVLLYFIDVPLIDQNGKILGYHWICENCMLGGNNISGQKQKVKADMRSIRLDLVAIRSAISISACTAVGCSVSEGYLRFMELTGRAPSHRIFLNRNSENLDLIWYLKNETSLTSPSILLCSPPTKWNSGYYDDCSSISKIDLGPELIGRRSIKIKDFNVGKFAFIPGLDGTEFSPIRWSDCIYETSNFQAEKKLQQISFNHSISKPECNLKSCTKTLAIKMPSCKEFRWAIFDGISVNYISNVGPKVLTRYFLAESEVTFTLNDLSPSQTYELRISVITYNNETINWNKHTIVTAWWNIVNVVLIALGVVSALTILCGVIYCYGKKKSDNMFETTYEKANSQHILRTNSVKTTPPKPITLNNAENRSDFQRIQQDCYSPSNSPIVTYGRTYSTNIEMTDNSDSSYNSSNSENPLVVDTKDSYIKRPDEHGKEIYGSLFMPVDKHNTLANNNIPRLSQETQIV